LRHLPQTKTNDVVVGSLRESNADGGCAAASGK